MWMEVAINDLCGFHKVSSGFHLLIESGVSKLGWRHTGWSHVTKTIAVDMDWGIMPQNPNKNRGFWRGMGPPSGGT